MMRTLGLAALAAGMAWAGTAGQAAAQNEQYMPALVYRTGAYAPNGIPFANGYVDYLNMLNERDGGINGVRLVVEECETGYATDKGVECYERMKGKGPTGATVFNPLSTGITFALTEKAPLDKIPIVTMGYGRSESADGRVFQWNFPFLGTYWSAADILLGHLGREKLKGKKIALVFHDSPYGREPIPVLEERAKQYGYAFTAIPVTHPGVEQKAAWLQIRQSRPDYVFLWGWGVMNSTAIKEAAAVGYPRDKMYGVWWSGAEPDVLPAGDGAKGYQALALHPAGQFPVHADIIKHVIDKGKSQTPKADVGHVLYNRGVVNAVLVAEAIRAAQEKYGKKPITGEQMRWGLENLTIGSERIRELGMTGLFEPFGASCLDHEGSRKAKIQQWDGKKWVEKSGWIAADTSYLRPKMEAQAKAYAAEKKITPVSCTAS